MQRDTLIGMLAALVLASGCGRDSGDSQESGQTGAPADAVLTADTLGEQTVRSNADYLAEAPYSAADPANGEAQARLCRACHTFERDGMNMLGPRLYGFFGKPVGTVEGFGYSNALLAADFVWTPRALDAWLQQPSRFLPGNMMAFGGIRDPGDRADLIAYLLAVTDNEGEPQEQ